MTTKKARTTKLEKRVAELEQRIANLEGQFLGFRSFPPAPPIYGPIPKPYDPPPFLPPNTLPGWPPADPGYPIVICSAKEDSSGKGLSNE